MPIVWENSRVEALKTLISPSSKVAAAVEGIRTAMEPLRDPDQVKILTAIAADVAAGIRSRNDRADVRDACAALENAIELLEAVDPNLDG